jgi:hypothetical protein
MAWPFVASPGISSAPWTPTLTERKGLNDAENPRIVGASAAPTNGAERVKSAGNGGTVMKSQSPATDSDELVGRINAEAQRLAQLTPGEWRLWYKRSAERFGQKLITRAVNAMWASVEGSRRNTRWCIEDSRDLCLAHVDGILGDEAKASQAIATAKRMIGDGTVPAPEYVKARMRGNR